MLYNNLFIHFEQAATLAIVGVGITIFLSVHLPNSHELEEQQLLQSILGEHRRFSACVLQQEQPVTDAVGEA